MDVWRGLLVKQSNRQPQNVPSLSPVLLPASVSILYLSFQISSIAISYYNRSYQFIVCRLQARHCVIRVFHPLIPLSQPPCQEVVLYHFTVEETEAGGSWVGPSPHCQWVTAREQAGGPTQCFSLGLGTWRQWQEISDTWNRILKPESWLFTRLL